MAEAPNISYAGSSAVATAVRVTTILTTAIQAIGDAPDDVRRVLNRVQEVRAAILRLPNPMQLSPATIGAQWPREWLVEAHRAIDATAAEAGGLHMRLSDWDQRRSARQIRLTWEAFHVVIPSGLLDTASRRIESAKTAIEILIAAVDLTSTSEITTQIERTRTIISNLLTDQQVVEAPVPHEPPPPYSAGPNGNIPSRSRTPGFNNSVGYVLVQYPNGTVGAAAAPQFVHPHQSFPIPARRRSSDQLGNFQNPTPAVTPEGSTSPTRNSASELATLKQEAKTLRQEAAALRQEVTTLREEAASLREEAVALKQETTTLKREAIVLKQDATSLKEAAITLKEESTAAKQEVSALKKESASKDVKISELELEVSTLKNRRDSVLAANPDPHDDILQKVISKYKNVKRLYFDSQKEIVGLKKDIEELKKQEYAAKSKDMVIEKWKEEFASLEKRLQLEQEGVEATISQWKEKHDSLMEERNSLQESMGKSLEELQAERDRLARELDATKDGLGSHEAELAATRSILLNTQNMLDERENRLANSLAAADDTRTELEHKLEDQTRRLQEIEKERTTVFDFVRRLSALGLDASRFLDESHSAAAS